MDDEEILTAMRRAVAAARTGLANPEAVLSGRFTGRSRAGTATAWVDALGRLDRLELAPGSVQEGDEAGVTTAVLEACAEARRAASEFALSGLPDVKPAPRATGDEEDFSARSPLRD
jgi:hypothetical protein